MVFNNNILSNISSDNEGCRKLLLLRFFSIDFFLNILLNITFPVSKFSYFIFCSFSSSFLIKSLIKILLSLLIELFLLLKFFFETFFLSGFFLILSRGNLYLLLLLLLFSICIFSNFFVPLYFK